MGAGASLKVMGYRLALIVTGGVALMLADRMTWPTVYLVMAALFESTLLPVSYDGAGRMVLPPFLRSEAGIGDTALFLGLGDYFEIWNPLKAREALSDDPMLVRMIDYYLEQRA